MNEFTVQCGVTEVKPDLDIRRRVLQAEIPDICRYDGSIPWREISGFILMSLVSVRFDSSEMAKPFSGSSLQGRIMAGSELLPYFSCHQVDPPCISTSGSTL